MAAAVDVDAMARTYWLHSADGRRRLFVSAPTLPHGNVRTS
jgi:hypothetical protein